MNKINRRAMLTKVIVLWLAGSILFSSCASTTMIQSNPNGARVYVNGEPVGTTPYTHRDSKIVGSVTTVKLEKEGYNSFNTTFTKDEEVDIGAIIGGVFLFIPFLWTMKYKPIHTYELIPNSENLKIADKTKIQNQINPKSKAERLRELKALLDEKVITQGEYENEKRKILEEDDKIK